MIEVEKKFQPTKEQLRLLLTEATLVKEKTMHDVYYDFSDYRIFKSGSRLRKRDGGFELKVYIKTNSGVAVADEYTDELKIKELLGLVDDTQSLADIVDKKMTVVCDFTTLRKEYKKEEFVIDVDEMSFGIGVVEIELLVEDESKIAEGEQKVLALATGIGMEVIDLPLKTEMYLKIMNPQVHKEIFGESKRFSEFKLN